MTIFLKMDGGLGNQILQYAYARWLTANSGRQVSVFSPERCNDPSSLNRAFQIGSVFKDCKKLTTKLPAFLHVVSLSSKFQRTFGSHLLRYHDMRQIYSWREILDETNRALTRPFPILCGYFQFKESILPMHDALRDSAHDSLSRNWNAISQQLQLSGFQAERDCLIHVRLGDYRLVGFPTLDSQYYAEAGRTVTLQGMNGRFFFCSDEPEAANTILKEAGIYAEVLNLENPFDVLTVFYRAKYKIIANSTLSFCGALLGDNGVTVFPRLWPRGMQDLPNIAGSLNWISADRS